MPSAIKTPKRGARRRSIDVTRPQPTAAIRIIGSVKSGSVLTITFDQPVSLSGVPDYRTEIAGAIPTSAARLGPAMVAITYSAAIAAADELTVPYEDPAVRNSSGGFVATSAYGI